MQEHWVARTKVSGLESRRYTVNTTYSHLKKTYIEKSLIRDVYWHRLKRTGHSESNVSASSSPIRPITSHM